jgi:hypothetical protein
MKDCPGKGSSIHNPTPQVSLEAITEELLRTSFTSKIETNSAGSAAEAAQYHLGGELVDLALSINGGTQLLAHQSVLGLLCPFFRELFIAVGDGQGDILSFEYAFPFPVLLDRLVKFFYLVTNTEFDLEKFLSDIDFGNHCTQFLLFSILSYFGEPFLAPRVRANLHKSFHSNTSVLDELREVSQQIKVIFTPSPEDF